MSTAPTKKATIPEFTAWPLTSKDDATVFVHTAAPPILGSEAFRQTQTSDYSQLSSYLNKAGPAAVDGRRAATLPRLSAAGIVTVRCTKQPHPHEARGLVCFADRCRSVSITLRSVRCLNANVETDDFNALPAEVRSEWFESGYRPSTERGTNWFSIDDQCRVLSESIFASTGTSDIPRAQGLVVLTGGTNSAKSLIARGLIELYLTARKTETLERQDKAPRRLPHLVTFEDPIETYLINPRKAIDLEVTDSAALARVLGDNARGDLRQRLCDELRQWPRALLAQWHGFDYTPREKGYDVHDLRQAFRDALRQTPSVFYVGEVRDPADWGPILEFAGTGHLVVTTAHAGSLLEAMVKILSSVRARTPADRRRFAARIRAVVHLRPQSAGGFPPLIAGRDLLLPALWRSTEAGLAALSANGFGAVVAECPGKLSAEVSTLGRRWFAEQLLKRTGDSTSVDLSSAFRNLAARLDLYGE